MIADNRTMNHSTQVLDISVLHSNICCMSSVVLIIYIIIIIGHAILTNPKGYYCIKNGVERSDRKIFGPT